MTFSLRGVMPTEVYQWITIVCLSCSETRRTHVYETSVLEDGTPRYGVADLSPCSSCGAEAWEVA